MQGIYTFIPETNYVPREYSVAAILLLLFMVLISLVSVLNLVYFYISTFRSTCALLLLLLLSSLLLSLLLLCGHKRPPLDIVFLLFKSSQPRTSQSILSAVLSHA